MEGVRNVPSNNVKNAQNHQSQERGSRTDSRSFAQATNSSKAMGTQGNEQFPNGEQGIIINAIQGTPLSEYIYAIGDVFGATSVKAASRIPGKRISMYLASEELVDRVTSIETEIFIGTNRLNIIPEKAKTRKIILSDVCPKIPHLAIEESLKALKIVPVSKITTINLNLNREGYAVASARRQVKIKEEDTLKLPETIKITFQNTQYMISTAVDSFACYKCREEGHIARNCPQTITPENCPSVQSRLSNVNNNTVPSLPTQPGQGIRESAEGIENQQANTGSRSESEIIEETEMDTETPSTKRQMSETGEQIKTRDDNADEFDSDTEYSEEQTSKKPRTDTEIPLIQNLRPSHNAISTEALNLIPQTLKEPLVLHHTETSRPMVLLEDYRKTIERVITDAEKDSILTHSSVQNEPEEQEEQEQNEEDEEPRKNQKNAEKWEVIKDMLEGKMDEYPLDWKKLQKFLEESKTIDTAINTALKYTENLKELELELEYVEDKMLQSEKRKIKRIRKKIIEHIDSKFKEKNQ